MDKQRQPEGSNAEMMDLPNAAAPALAITEGGLSAFESCSGLCFLASEIQEAAMLGHAHSSCDS